MSAFRHEALIYERDHELVERLGPFLGGGPADSAPTVAVLTRRNQALLRDELGPELGHVAFVDCEDVYVDPVRALAAFEATLEGLFARGAPSVRVAGEIPLHPSETARRQWTTYEALLNHALADRRVWVLCLYDGRTVSDEMLEAVWRTHPQVDGNGAGPNGHYPDPAGIVAAMAPHPADVQGLRTLAPTDDPLAFRELLAAELASAGVPEAGTIDLLVAAGEVFENARTHGGGLRGLRAGLADGWFVCEISDRGPGVADPLAGYLPPRLQRGAGLWIARQLVSRLELIPAATGLRVRLWL